MARECNPYKNIGKPNVFAESQRLKLKVLMLFLATAVSRD
jgi:hypothetical protein